MELNPNREALDVRQLLYSDKQDNWQLPCFELRLVRCKKTTENRKATQPNYFHVVDGVSNSFWIVTKIRTVENEN